MDGTKGYSSKIEDSAFEKFRKDTKSWSLIFSGILAVIAVIAFPVYGEFSGEMEMPYSLFYGLGIGGMFMGIALFQVISKSRDSTWDGVVEDKQIYDVKRFDNNSDSYNNYTVYEYAVRRDDNGKLYSHSTENDATVYNYYAIGDKVRHHKGLGLYEKYDKSNDTFLFCTACSSINDIADDHCFRCKCPLLK